jgi:hypothetical protein
MVLIVLGWSTPLPRGWTPWRDQTVSLLGIIGAPILGGLIASRLPRNPYGWLWLGFGLGLAIQSLAMSYEAYALVVEPGSLAAPRTISHVLELGGQVALTLAPLLMLLFPTGRLPSRRWRPLAWISTTAGAVLLLLVLLFENPDQVGGVISITTFAVVYVIFTAILLSALSIVVRYRRAGGAERQQLKWFALAAVLIGAVTAGHLLFLDALLPEALVNMLDAVTITVLYVAVGIAILRYRLYDIDIIINRTLVPHPGLRFSHRDTRSRLLRERRRIAVHLARPHRPGIATGYRGLHARDSRTFQPLEAAYPELHRPQLLPAHV